MLMIATASLELRGVPAAERATCGMPAINVATSRSRMLSVSLFAALRRTITFSSEPVARSACWMPRAIISTALNTKTTSAMPRTVMLVVKRRAAKLRTM